MKVAFFSTKPYDQKYFDQTNLAKSHELTYFESPLSKLTSSLSAGFEAVCVFVNDGLDREVIEELSQNQVKLIALRCAGYNNVDLKAAQEFGIRVVNVPSYSPHAVAEFTLALALTLNRKTHKAYSRVREGNFSLENLDGFDFYQKTVGVIGTGQIGAIFCQIMKGFGCELLAYDLYPSKELEALGVNYVSMQELLSRSDVVSLHCPLTPETHHLIDHKALAQMKPHVMLLNTSRGALIHTKDAIQALKSGKIGYLGIDVYEHEEDLFFEDLSEHVIQDELILRLMSFPNVLVTSHQGFFTKEALGQIASTTLANLSGFETGDALRNEVKLP